MTDTNTGACPSDTGLLPSGEPVPVSPAVAATIPSAFANIAALLPSDLVWAYKATVRGGRLYHQWELVGPRGGVHVSAMWSPSQWSNHSWIGGIEGHSPIPMYDYNSGKPDHAHCWLIDAPCWHDGSSLQFSEEIAPMLPYQDGVMGEYEHRAILHTMLNRYESWLPAASAIEARRAETGTGSVEDESAIGEAETPHTPSQDTPHANQ